MSPALEVRTIRRAEALAEYGRAWDAMVAAMPRPTPYLLHEWLVPWWREYPASRPEIRIALDGGRPVGALPLTLERRAGLRVLRFPCANHRVLGDILLADDAPPATAGALVEDLRAHPVHDLVDLDGLPGDSLLARLGGEAGDLRPVPRVEAPVLTVTESWEGTYAARVRGRHRAKNRRQRRQLGELGALRTRIVRAPEEMTDVLAQASRVHRLRWAGRPDGSDFGTSRGLHFRAAAYRALARADRARVAVLELDGRVIAFQAYLLLAGRMFIDRNGFDPAFARYGPGVIVVTDALEAGVGEGATRIEFLGAADGYKMVFADGLDPMFAARGFATTTRGRIALRALDGAAAARRRAKHSPRLRHLYFETLAPARRAVQRLHAT